MTIAQELRHILTQHTLNQLAGSGDRLMDSGGNSVNSQILYAAIFEQSSGPTKVMHYSLADEQRQRIFDQLKDQGYRLVSRSVSVVNNQVFFTGIFEKGSDPPWVSYSGLPSEQFQREFDRLTDQGYRLRDMNGYALNSQVLYITIFEHSDGPLQEVRYNLTSEQLQQTFDQLTAQGYRLRDVSGYGVSNQALYTAIFEQSDGPLRQARYGLTAEQFQQTFDQLVDQGYRLVDQSAYIVNGQVLWAGIFEKRSGPLWVAYAGLTSEQFQRKFDRLTGRGYRLLQVCGYRV